MPSVFVTIFKSLFFQVEFITLVAASFFSFAIPLLFRSFVFMCLQRAAQVSLVDRNVFSQLSNGYLIKTQLISKVHTNPIFEH